jgi:transposase
MTDAPLSINPVRIGSLPILRRIVEKLGIENAFVSHVKHDSRDKIPVSQTLVIALYNVITERYPLYKMGEWALHRGVIPQELSSCFTDDRIGRGLDRLFTADRSAIITDVVLRAIAAYGLEFNRIHNDSTSITLFGDYEHYADTKAAKPLLGHNKDHRPDLKQLVFSLSVTDDGAVPLYFKVWDGNITDDTTHIRNWSALRALVGHAHFIYVADCKLCVRESMQYIHTEGGSFVTVMPETRQEIGRFRQWICDNTPQWQDAVRLPNTRKKDGTPRVFWTFDSPFLSSEGYRIVWVKSLDKQREDEERRTGRIERTEESLSLLSSQTYTNKEKLDQKVLAALQENQSKDYFDWQIVMSVEENFKQQSPGRPTATTTFCKIEKNIYRLTWCQKADRIQYEARYDGIFPLITNRKECAREILEYYKYQPYLEKRHEQLKSVYDVAPVFLKNPQRIEALLLLYFLGMLVTSLLERTVRKEMKKRQLTSIPIYPEGRPCKDPTADKILGLFSDVRLQYICREGKIIQVVPDGLSQTQCLVLGLIGFKPEMYFESS